ncbi:MAG: hypothetical protein Q3963_00465 [Coriobacteriaceae bacterium]|nr:hypothetical protein [Coriobacteriaceae bacterium]
MSVPSNATALEVMFLQAADDGRGEVLFGQSLERARAACRPFMVGDEFPDVYFEFPLAGDPFLDITLLYSELAPGMRIDSPAAAGAEPMLDWCAGVRSDYDDVCCGFELDTKNEQLPAAAVHFQPRRHTELVAPFCEAIGEPERAHLYLDLNARMPEGWKLSFFGLFRGRPNAPLRVCGYLGDAQQKACAEDPRCIAVVFDQIGFTAYNDAMIAQIAELLARAPGTTDFQFDVFPDGRLGNVFAIDVQFGIQQPEAVREAFDTGSSGCLLRLLERWGIADSRWKLAGDAAFARAIPVQLEDGSPARFAFTLMPQWTKVRWIDGVLQPAKHYRLAHAGLLE